MLTKILNRGANALKNALRGIVFGKLQTRMVGCRTTQIYLFILGMTDVSRGKFLGFYLKYMPQ